MRLLSQHFAPILLCAFGAFPMLDCGGAESSISSGSASSGSGGATGSSLAGSGGGVTSGSIVTSGTLAAAGSGAGGNSGRTASGSTTSGTVAVSGNSGGSGTATSGLTSSGAATSGTSSSGTASSGSSVPPHRPQPVSCAPTVIGGPGPTARLCMKDVDCLGDSGFAFDGHCLNHTCTFDQCLNDTDCAPGAVCGCANQFGGNAIHINACVASTCRVDADCASGLCSPARTAYCGSLSGYHCRSAADTCGTDADCASRKSDAGFSLPDQCSYEPTVGHWQCAPITICAG
ncbi:MAG TPA: hypothetical protein VGY54_00325 [Polyangiaceae bacterium]|nr:hypothetical protein [Polyangiaceae bacterium]